MGKTYTLTKNVNQNYLVIEKLIQEINQKHTFLDSITMHKSPFDQDLITIAKYAICATEKLLLKYLREE
jgi:hypothetical protein